MRVLPLVEGGGKIIVVGGMVHRSLIVEQLEAVGATAQILLEPEGRDSAPAMAAAAAWTLAHDPDGVNVFVSSDHYVPQKGAFIDAVKKAVVGAEQKRIVTLGIRPTEPSTAYGYIAPSGSGLSDVERFVEKPDLEAAKGFLASGYLWNAGIFICRADVLHREFEACESTVWQVAASSLAGVGEQSIAVLGRDFRKAPKISIDYAVMENTECASVLEVDFHWTDLGAWDAIAARGDGEYGAHIFEDAEGCMVRAPEGTLVAALGVRDLGIIVENDAVLVCDLSRSQEVKKIVERVKVLSPQHLDFHVQKPADIKETGKTFFNWMRLRALPVWHSLGQEEDGVFAEALTLTGGDVSLTHRLRVQTRQLYCFAEAGRMGWGGRWRSTVEAGLAALDRYFLYEDGLVVSAIHPDRTPVGREALIYDQAFALFAWASVFRHGIQAERVRDRAVALLERLKRNWLPQGGIKEFGSHPYQSNAHMHLLEACISWAEVDSDPRWMQMADSIVELAMSKFIDAERGCLREFFDENWNPEPGDSGRIVEPGHQFEWLWLLLRYGKLRNDTSILASVKPLYAWGQKGFWDTASVMLDSLNDDGTARVRRARLWPQTEWLKAALLMAEQSGEADRKAYLEDAAAALRSLKLYLTPEGLWHDKRVSNQSFIDEPSPATSFYHIMGACSQLAQTNENLRLDIRSAGFAKILH